MAYYTTKQIHEMHPGLSPGRLRWMVRASTAHTRVIKGKVYHVQANGFGDCWTRPNGRTILIDNEKLMRWLETRGRCA